MLSFADLIRIARPRFWLYSAWSFLIWIVASGYFPWLIEAQSIWIVTQSQWIVFGVIMLTFLYFLFPANLLIYGVNDIADQDTDAFNAKKWSYEERHSAARTQELQQAIIRWNVGSLLIIYGLFRLTSMRWSTLAELLTVDFSIGLFILAAVTYSMPPIRFKARPFLDGASNVLYIIPGLTWFFITWWTLSMLSIGGFVAAWLRAMAMHTFSAVPDIKADRQAWIETTATFLWYRRTLWYCRWVWLLATSVALRSLPEFTTFWVVLWLLYSLVSISAMKLWAFRVYKRMPWINWIVGFVLFWMITLT